MYCYVIYWTRGKYVPGLQVQSNRAEKKHRPFWESNPGPRLCKPSVIPTRSQRFISLTRLLGLFASTRKPQSGLFVSHRGCTLLERLRTADVNIRPKTAIRGHYLRWLDCVSLFGVCFTSELVQADIVVCTALQVTFKGWHCAKHYVGKYSCIRSTIGIGNLWSYS